MQLPKTCTECVLLEKDAKGNFKSFEEYNSVFYTCTRKGGVASIKKELAEQQAVCLP